MVEGKTRLRQVLGVTALAAVLPGAGYIAVRRPHVGALLLTCQLTLAVALTVLLWRHRRDIGPLFVWPEALAVIMVGAPLLGLAWAGVVVHCAALTGRGLRYVEDRVICGIAALAAATVIALPLAATGWYAGMQRELMLRVFAPPAPPRAHQPPDGADRLNLLLLGSDGGEHRLGLHTDSITVASIDRRTGDTVLFSLPSDLERPPFPPGGALAERFPAGFDDTLGAVYPFGKGHPELLPGTGHPGGAATAQAAGQVLGLPVDNFVLVDMEGFADLVDAWGGLPMTVRRPLPFAPDGRYLEPGTYTLNGDDALGLARTRRGGGNYARMGRHPCVLAALATRPAPGTLLRFGGLVETAKHSVITDIPRSQVPELFRLAGRMRTASFTSVQLAPPLLDPGDPDFSRVRDVVSDALRRRPGGTKARESRPASAACPADPSTGPHATNAG